uniref:Uncharacterized protein n=1 Tax=Rhizophora mucronata TaxID=61149 RepID=A0A2P2IIH8_RHIMU
MPNLTQPLESKSKQPKYSKRDMYHKKHMLKTQKVEKR